MLWSRRSLGLAAVVAVMGLVAACASDDEGAGTSGGGEPLVVGAAVAKSGIMSQFDEPEVQGAQVAISEINAEGGVGGRPLKLVVSDHKSDLNLVQQSALDVIDQGAEVVMTTHDFDYGSPAAQVANAENILTLGGAGGMSYGLQGIGPLAFNLYPGNATEGAVMAQFAHDQRWKQPYVLQDLSIQYTKEVCEFFTEAWKGLGDAAPVGQSSFQNDDRSFSSQVNAVRDSGADSVVLCSYPPGGPAIIRQLRAAGVDLPIVASGGGMDGIRWLDAVPNLSNYYDSVMASLVGDDPNKEINKLFAEIDQRFGAPPQLAAQALTGYAAMQTIKRAVEATDGSTDGAELAAAIEGFKDEPLVHGPVTYSAECHIPVGMPMKIRQVQNGESSYFKTADPESIPRIALLSTDDVRVHFEGVRAIDGVSLSVERGEILGLIGPNGAGKTTLVNVITGLQPPDAGTVHLEGVDITPWSTPRRARAGLGRTFQGARLFDRLSVLENVEAAAVAGGLRRRAARARTAELLAVFRLEDVARHDARTLPHGTARRLGVARALALAPSYVLLDEPAAGLDEGETRELVSLLRDVRDRYDVGLVVIEHDVPLIMSLCERIHVLHHGETLAVGPPEAIARDEQVIGAYLGEAGGQEAPHAGG